ncbi:MAG TPA: adenylate/guanylate cyclase domain-containing protein [Actinomycetota bacterium]|nr:adenylate/guanylate cyclase domain-containing protein [Actinomycetota bacterium]
MAICPACGKENPDQFRLCGFCGSPLRGTAGARVEERKIVSVLFVDLVGFTARSHSADPEDVRAALRPYHERLKREIERFGGTVEKFIGDAVMAVFGAPVTHEDDSERAVRAALRINEAIAELNETTPGLDLSLRTAVNTGEGLVSLGARPEAGEGMVTGDVVNTASRLESIAPVNGVVVGEQTYRSTKEVIDYEDLRPVRVKGKPDPVPVWRALSAKSRFEADVEAAYATPFIGREDELELLKRSYSRSVREPSVQLVTITGEPGVGKSRLLAEFFSVVDKEQGSTLRQGRCLPYGEGITFWALGEVVKAQAGILQSDSADEAGAKLATALGAVIDDPTERPWFQARLGALVGAAAPAGVASKEESFAAWRRFLEAVATTGPFVVAIEDLHWADPSLLEFIEHLVEWTTGVPLLVMTTARPELYDKHPSWAGGIRNAATISLSPLSKEKTSELVSALLSTAVLPSEMHAALIDRAGGNPLYAEEFVHMLTDRGMLERRGPVVSLPNGGNIPLPDSVQALIAARLDTLSPEHKALLQDAAVAGNVFWAGAVAAMQRVSQEAVIEKLHHLTRKEIVRPVRISSIGNEREYSFWHALIRDVSYAQIPRAVRAAKHQAMAAWIERRAETRIADHAEILAHHYSQALRLARAAGDPAAGSLEEPARSHLVAAGDRAAELDLAAAVAYYIRALDLFPAGHPERAEALTKAGVAARNAGHLDDAAGLLEEAINEARHAGDERTEGGAMVQLAGVEWYRGKTQRSIAISAAAVELLEGEHVGPELAFAYDRLATAAGFSGDSARALELNDKAMAIARTSGDQRLLVRVGTTRGDTLCALGDLSGLDDLRRAVKQALDLELSGPATYAYSALCEWVWLEEGPAAGREAYAEAIEFLTKRGMMTLICSSRSPQSAVRPRPVARAKRSSAGAPK